jgi:hypothetical protein
LLVLTEVIDLLLLAMPMKLSNNMNEKKIKELVGIITEKELTKVYSQGKNRGKLYYRLLVKCENRPQVKKIFAYKEIVEKESV